MAPVAGKGMVHVRNRVPPHFVTAKGMSKEHARRGGRAGL